MAAADHYIVLGLPSGEEVARLSEQEITKAYRNKARELHPDKRRHDPYAHANFLKLQSSYQLLKDENKRKLFDDDLRRRRRVRSIKNYQNNRRQQDDNSKRRKMMSDLHERELSAANFDRDRDREKDVMISRKFKEEIASIFAKHTKKVTPKQGTTTDRGKDSSVDGLELDEGKFNYNYPRRRNIAGHQAFEDSVLAKLQTAAQRQTQT